MKLRLATIAALAAVAATASPANAGVTCQTDAAAAIAGANVNGPREGWTPPFWTFDMPSLSMSVDVQADTLSEAQSKATAVVQGEIQVACQREQAGAGSTGGATTSTTTQSAMSASYPEASALVASAPIQYVGASMWRLTFSAQNLTVDVQAADEQSARTVAIPAVAQAIGETPTSGTLATMSTTDATDTTSTDATVSVSKTVTAGSWSGAVDPDTGIPVSAGIP